MTAKRKSCSQMKHGKLEERKKNHFEWRNKLTQRRKIQRAFIQDAIKSRKMSRLLLLNARIL